MHLSTAYLAPILAVWISLFFGFGNCATVKSMKNLTNTQGSVWMAVLVIIAVVVAALLLSGNLNFMEDETIKGRVDQVNQEEQYFIVSHIEILSVAEDGNAEIEETTYTIIWNEEDEIGPDLPSSLTEGQMVEIMPREELDEGQTMFILGELDIVREAEIEEASEQQAESSNESPGPVEAGLAE